MSRYSLGVPTLPLFLLPQFSRSGLTVLGRLFRGSSRPTRRSLASRFFFFFPDLFRPIFSLARLALDSGRETLGPRRSFSGPALLPFPSRGSSFRISISYFSTPS